MVAVYCSWNINCRRFNNHMLYDKDELSIRFEHLKGRIPRPNQFFFVLSISLMNDVAVERLL